MAFELDVSQATDGILRVADFPDLARAPIREALRATADTILADAFASVSRSGGRSQPGQPPASHSGGLLHSLRTRVARSRKRDERAYVLAAEFYGFMLESGTRRIRPRPFLIPAAQRHVSEFVSRVEAAVSQAVQQTNAP